MEEVRSPELYGTEWFRNRAFSSLRQREDGIWDFSDSLLLYLPDSEGIYEEVQQTETPYHRLVTEPERAYLENIAPKIMSGLPQEFAYVDLGPGTEHKEQFVFDAAQFQHKHFSYWPVDISNRFLKLAAEYASKQGIETHPERSSFEEVPERLLALQTPRFVSLGLTYSNYEPESILRLLKSISAKNGSIFVNSQIRERVDMNEIQKLYEDVVGIAKPKLKLLGLDIERDVSELRTDDGIRAWCTLKNSTPQLERKGLTAGSTLLVFQSLRPSKKSFEQDIASVFPSYELLDTNEPFIGALLRT